MSTDGDAAHLGKHVRARREELDLNQLEVAAAGGPSNSTQTQIEHDRLEVLTRQTARRIDTGLQWEPGSARRVWQGGEPTPLLPGVPPNESAKLRRAILEAAIDEDTRVELLRVLGGSA